MRIWAGKLALFAMILLAAIAGQQAFAQTDGPFGKPKDTASSTENSSGDSSKTPEKKLGDKKPAKVDLDPKEAPDARLARAWKAFFTNKLSEALQLADSLAKAQSTTLALEARHISARCNWAMGQAAIDAAAEGDLKAVVAGKQSAEKYFAEARKIWKELSASTASANVKRQSIATALELAAKDKSDEACEELNKVLLAEYADTCTCEAGILYAEIRARQGQIKDALKACKFASDFGGRLPSGNEITLATVRPFIDAVAALERRLKTEPAASAFAAAERLRNQKKFTQAISAYENIFKDFPETDFAPRSRFSVGLCKIGLEKPADAIAHWKTFIKEEPSGPWRGQSYIGIVDANLEQLFEPSEAMAAADEAGKMLDSALADAKSTPSWKPIRFDILYRSGMLSYSQGKYEDALERLETAQKVAESLDDEGKAGLGRLIEGAKNKSRVIPLSVKNAAEPRIHLLLSVGSMYIIIHKTRDAERYFDLVLTELAKSSASKSGAIIAEQKSYALFGKGLSRHFRQEWDEAKKNYQAALDACKDAAWHDQTLYQLGLAIMQQAQKKYYGSVATATHRTCIQPAEEQKKDAAAKSEAMKTYNKERLASLPFWEQLLAKFPKSQYAPAAMYSVGIFTFEAGDRKKGADLLEKFITTKPDSPYAGEALLVVSRYDLEYLADRDKAWKHLNLLEGWTDAIRKKDIKPSADAVDDPNRARSVYSQPKDGKTGRFVFSASSKEDRDLFDMLMLDDCFLCDWYLKELDSHSAQFKGFMYLVDEKPDDARKEFERLNQIDPAKIASQGAWGGGIYGNLMAAIKTGKMLASPEEMKQYKDRQRLAVMLGDFYYGIWQFTRSAAMAQRLLAGEFGPLNGSARDYPQCLYAMNVSLTTGKAAAVDEFVKVFKDPEKLKGPNVSFSMDRAAFCAANLAWACFDGELQEKGAKIWEIQAYSGRKNEWTLQALFSVAITKFYSNQREECYKMLEQFPDTDPALKEAAGLYLNTLKDKDAAEAREQARKAQSSKKGTQ
ncbi:MAG: tetratricopeptide repeat protein [Planctomycetes bacterium]|nr:tetratricopeptide repeat protein [Planctomycetota bacterium]